MKLEIPYLKKQFSLEFPGENLLALAEPNEYTAEKASGELIAAALEKPYGADGKQNGISLPDFLRGGKKLLVIINDATRPTPTEAMLTGLLPVIEEAGLGSSAQAGGSLRLIVATGAHRAPAEEEYRQILGCHYEKLRGCCVYHDARNDNDMVDIGTTRNGTPMLLNKKLFEADRIISTGSVEPHYFAGFTGGRKAFLPGIASYKTIEANHKQALSPNAKSLALEGNPVHEDMMDALPLITAPVFSLMTVLDKEQGVAAVCAGDLMASFYAAVDIAKKIFCVAVPSKADIVVSVAKFPMDIDLYQSQKAIDNGAVALNDGGFLILVSSCRDGIGDEAYANLLAHSSSPADAIEKIRAGYKLGFHKAAKMAEVSRRATILAVSELSEDRLKSMFIEKAASPQDALDKALSTLKAKGTAVPKILVLPDGCVTVPDPNAYNTGGIMRIPMRRKERETSREEALAALDRAPCGILSVIAHSDEPYCVPLSLARDGDWLYFHCALDGYKIKNLREKPKVCAAFVSAAEFPEDQFTVMYESAIVFGAAEEVHSDEEKLHGLRLISNRFTPKLMHTFDEYAGRMLAKTSVWKIHIDEITGKRRKKPRSNSL